MLAASSRKHIAMAGRLGSGPALGPQSWCSHNRAMSTQDLTDAEFAELDELLAATPEPLQPLDASMLDGYLCGVIVQPRLIDVDEWLPNIFDYDGGRLPETVDAG